MTKYIIQVIPDTAIQTIQIELNDDREEIELDEIEEMLDEDSNPLFYEIKSKMNGKYFTVLSDAVKLQEG